MDAVDENYIWQRRIAHGIRYQKGPVPFPESVAVGLEFNAALERKEKLDLSLLTNGVMLDICDFAKTVTKSEKYFLFEMLEFNFELGVDADNDQHRYVYALRVHNKVKQLKEQIRLKPNRWKETFQLPDPNTGSGSDGSGVYCPKWNRVADSSVLTDSSKNSPPSETQKAENNGVASSTYVIKRRGGIRLKRTDDVYRFCTQLGVTLHVRPNQTLEQKLDRNLITSGVMMELLDFSRALCGTHTHIVYDLVKQNFGLELDKLQVRMQINRLTDRKYGCLTADDRDAFRKELFKVQTAKKREQKCRKRKQPDADCDEVERQTTACQRRETLRRRTGDAEEIRQDGDLSYTCPVEFETETQSETEAGPEDTNLESSLSEVRDVEQEGEEVFVSPAPPPTNSRHVNEDAHKQKLWLRRAARSTQILTSRRVNDAFSRCRDIGVDFSVGSGANQNLDLQLFTNWVLWEVYKFATAMTKSLRSFLFDILHRNFKLALQDDLHERNFIFYMITKEKTLVNHRDRGSVAFLSRPYHFPDVYSVVDDTSGSQTEQEVNSQQDLDSPDSATNQEADVETHPFCKQLGLNLWSTEERPASHKLDLTALTTGATLEIFSFVRELCGSVRDIVNDVLEHNFDVDLRSGKAEAAQVLQRWYATQKTARKQNMSPKMNRWLNALVPLNGHSKPNPPPLPTRDGLPDPDTEDGKQSRGTFKRDTPRIGDYHICQDVGLDLDVGSKSEDKAKLDLRVLTRAVLLEMHRYVEQNCSRYVPALYEILEYNFDLSPLSHRKVEFAWSVASQVRTIAGKNGRKGGYLSKVFELPFEISESSRVVCKDEPEDGVTEDRYHDDDDITFVRKLKAVDIEVEID